MTENKLLNTIRLKNILSYSTTMETLPLESLNVLIGTNASGKSNLIEAISLLAAAPNNILIPIREGGGITEWLWKGSETSPIASIETTLSYPLSEEWTIRYSVAFTCSGNRFELVDEAVLGESATGGTKKTASYYAYQNGYPVLNTLIDSTTNDRQERQLQRRDVSIEQSILSQRREADLYPELTYLATQFSQCRFYREWNLGRDTAPRLPQKADLPDRKSVV